MQSDHLEALLSALAGDGREAGVTYRQLHRRLTRFFNLNGAFDSEALADEGMDRLARRISSAPGGEVQSPQAFVLGIARHLLQEESRRQRREEEAVGQWASRDIAGEGHDEDLLHALDHCMDLMRADQRTLLRTYYSWTGRRKIEHHRQLAKSLGLTLNAMRNRLMRARNELDKCIRKRCSDVLTDLSTTD